MKQRPHLTRILFEYKLGGNVAKPWTDGPKELLHHAIEHLSLGGDFDRRIALISIDNAVEIMVKTVLGLPRRAREGGGPSRKELEEASDSFPRLLDLLEKYEVEKILDFDLDDIEWYHRLRNQLYHGGNGMTVEVSKVEAYYQLASRLYCVLFQEDLRFDGKIAVNTKTGEFLYRWNEFEEKLHEKLPPKDLPAYFWKRGFLEQISPSLAVMWENASIFRNMLIHGFETPNIDVIIQKINDVETLKNAVDAFKKNE